MPDRKAARTLDTLQRVVKGEAFSLVEGRAGTALITASDSEEEENEEDEEVEEKPERDPHEVQEEEESEEEQEKKAHEEWKTVELNEDAAEREKRPA